LPWGAVIVTWRGREIENTYDLTDKVISIPQYCVGVELDETTADLQQPPEEEDEELLIFIGIDLTHPSVYTSSIQMKEILNLKYYHVSELWNYSLQELPTTPWDTHSLDIDDSEPLSQIINRKS